MAYWSNKQLGKYQIKELLGQGAMAEVYKAYQPALERDVAVKIIHPHLAEDPDFVSRFKHEAKIIATLHHPAIVQIYDFDIEDDTFFMVMQFVPGTNLQKHLTMLYQQSDTMPLEEALALFQQIVEAVAYAHRQGIVHQDLKPSNVLLTADGYPFLADFGLSKIIGSDRLTGSGAIIGTPTYMSPEQGSGDIGDTRSDIYSLGVILYEMTTGTPPFSGDSPISTILKHLDDPLPPPRSINPALPAPIEGIIKTALKKERSHRFQTAQELLDALNELDEASIYLPPDTPTPVDPRCPYRGLQVFDTEHAEFFFGRETLVDQAIDRLQAIAGPSSAEKPPRFLAVLGASGSGKSSLVRAGLVPALQSGSVPDSDRWQIRILRPGGHPLEELTSQLAGLLADDRSDAESHIRLKASLTADGRALHHTVAQAWLDAPAAQKLLLVVDQFEEVFTLCHHEPERWRFIESLLYAASVQNGRIIVILTMRADFYHRCTTYRDLANRISTQQLLVGQMNEIELRRAIIRPAQQVGLKFEPGLVQMMLTDTAQQPGGLPLLQHSLLELWERREGNLLTLDAYKASGGVAKAITQRADAIYEDLGPNEQTIVRRIMLRLTQPGEGTEDTRRRAKKQELLPQGNAVQIRATEEVLQKLADARLITTSRDSGSGQEMVDVSHEALIRGWSRLRNWIDEDRVALRVHRQLTEAANEWLQANREPSYLYQGARLAQAEEWADTHPGDLNELEQAFLDASRAAARAAAEEKERRQQRELAQAQALAEEQRQRAEIQSRSGQRLRWLAAGLTVMVVIAAVVAYLAVGQWREAQRQTEAAVAAQTIAETERSRAEYQAQLALSRQLAAQAKSIVNDQLDLAMLLSLEARRLISETLQTGRDPLLDLSASPHLKQFLHGHVDFADTVAFSPDGSILASGSDDKTIILWDPATGQPLGPPLAEHSDQIWTIAFSPDGQLLASAGRDHEIRLWRMPTGQLAGSFSTKHGGIVTDLDFSPDGSLLASASADRTVRLWNVAQLHPHGPPLTIHTEEVHSVAFSPDGSLLASGSSDRTIILWDVATRRPFSPRLTGHTDIINDLDFSPDGALLASASGDQSIILWDVATRRQRGTRLIGHEDLIQTITFSPDGRLLASGGKDRTVRLWDVQRRQLASPPLDSIEWVRELAFSPDGQTLAAAGDHNPVLLWDVEASRYLKGHDEWVNSVAFSANGQLLASGSDDNTVRLWDIEARRQQRPALIGHTDHVLSVAFSPDNQMVASAGSDQSIIRWDVASGRAINPPITGHTDWISSLAFHPQKNNVLLASSSADTTVRLWNRETGTALAPPLTEHTAGVLKVVISPNGQTMASSGGSTIWLHDIETGQPLGPPLQGHDNNVWALAFSPDGQILASGSDDDTIILWDIARGEPLGPPLLGHTNDVWGLDFSPDGQILASGSRDSTVILWDVATGRPLSPPLTGHTNWIWGIDYSPTESLLASGGRDSDIILWDIDDRSPDLRLCQVAGRNLLLSEWQQYMPDQPYHKTCPNLVALPQLTAAARQLAIADDLDAAIAKFEEITALNPDSTINPAAEAQKFAAQGLIKRGQEAARAGELEVATSLFQRALALDRTLDLEPQARARQETATGLLLQGRALAREGRLDAAIEQFERILQLNPDLSLDPETEARQLAGQSLIEQAEALAGENDLAAAVDRLEQALAINPQLSFDPAQRARQAAAQMLVEQAEESALTGEIREALALVNEAETLAPSIEITSRTWHILCRYGAIEQQAEIVLDACRRAVALAPYDGWMHDARGLARALTGDHEGAIEDFAAFINWFSESPRFQEIGLKRERWIVELETGHSPFDAETLEAIRQE